MKMIYYGRLRDLREETYGDNKIKQRDLANYIGVSLNTYRAYECESAIFPIKHLIKVCEFYGVSLDYIFGFTELKNYLNDNFTINTEKSRKRIRLFRTNLYLTMKDLGKFLNCSESNINDYEAGRAIISTKKLYKLCKTYCVSADFLLGRIDEPKRIETGNGQKMNLTWYDFDIEKYEYSNILRTLRNEKNLLQRDVSNILSLDSTTYGQYESGSSIIPIKHLDTLSSYYDVSIDYMLGLSDIRKYNNSKNIDNKLSGKRLKNLRKSHGYSQDKLAKELNTFRSTISGYEIGSYSISTDLLYKLCEKFNISADYILGKVDESNIKDNN